MRPPKKLSRRNGNAAALPIDNVTDNVKTGTREERRKLADNPTTVE